MGAISVDLGQTWLILAGVAHVSVVIERGQLRVVV